MSESFRKAGWSDRLRQRSAIDARILEVVVADLKPGDFVRAGFSDMWREIAEVGSGRFVAYKTSSDFGPILFQDVRDWHRASEPWKYLQCRAVATKRGLFGVSGQPPVPEEFRGLASLTDLEREAQLVGMNRGKVLQQLRKARAMLSDVYRPAFVKAKFCRGECRLYSSCGIFALEWRMREFPDQPISETNQQTKYGGVFFVCVNEDAAIRTPDSELDSGELEDQPEEVAKNKTLEEFHDRQRASRASVEYGD